jgi:serine/threonine-protein kinase
LTPGDLLNDRYRLDEPVAGGGMGDVWRATDTLLGRPVAVKVLRPGAAADPTFAARFRDEARSMAALHHPGVADVYDYDAGTEGQAAFLVTAYVEGQPLDQLIAAAGRLGAAETMSVVAQAARALDAVHQAGVIHRDVTPANLIVQPDGTAVLIDFGIARSPDSAAVTNPGQAVGTARYMSPEQVSGQPVAATTDLYSLGVVAYHCLAGRPPFLGDDAMSVALRHLNEEPPPLPGDVPVAVRDVVTRAMAKNPADRFPTGAALAAAADSAVAGTAAVAPSGPATAAGPAARPAGGTAPVAGTAPIDVGPVADAPAVQPAARRGRRAAAWAVVFIALVALGIVLVVADPTGLMPGSDRPPASPAPTPTAPGTQGGGPGGGGGPAGGGSSGNDAPLGSGSPGVTGGGSAPGQNPGNPGTPGTPPAGTPTSTPGPTAEPTTTGAPTATNSPGNATTGPSPSG